MDFMCSCVTPVQTNHPVKGTICNVCGGLLITTPSKGVPTTRSVEEEEELDFLQDILEDKIPLRKLGRNHPCPCGSGLKVKKCGCLNGGGLNDFLKQSL